jgi:hypothetical protein
MGDVLPLTVQIDCLEEHGVHWKIISEFKKREG